MELVQEYHSLYIERLKHTKSNWIEGCEEIFYNISLVIKLRYPVVPGTEKVYLNGELKRLGYYVFTDDRTIHFNRYSAADKDCLVTYTGYEVEEDSWS